MEKGKMGEKWNPWTPALLREIAFFICYEAERHLKTFAQIISAPMREIVNVLLTLRFNGNTILLKNGTVCQKTKGWERIKHPLNEN